MTKNKSNIDRLYEQLVARFVRWAETCSDIRAAVIIGSRARIDHPADEWADLDVMIITTDPKRYLSTTDWLENIGNPLLTFIEPTSTGDAKERRVLFEGMLDVDVAIFPEKEFKIRAQQFTQGKIPPQIAAQILDVFVRGMRVLVDKDGMIAELQTLISSVETPSSRPPSQHEFLEAVNDFWYHAVFTAKHLRRGELWWAVTCLNCYMQRLLLRTMEWHALATHGGTYDTWFRGRFLKEWAPPRALKELPSAFSHYDEDDVKHALFATMNLFCWIAMETAQKLGYPYPTKADKQVTNWVRTCLSKRYV